MADVVSAGTFVAAVLEQAGYLTQGDFLLAFKTFFRDAGALVYFLGAVGGVLSLVLFGSFRASRYLIFGPAIYWALVGPTVEIDGVVAKLGGGESRGFVGNKGQAQAAADRDAVNEKAGKDTGRAIKVAEGFWLFAHPINDFVNEFVDVMLKDEDGENLMVEHKVRGLELISRSLPQTPEAINMLEEELLKYCPRMYNSALGVAQNYIKARSVEGLNKTAAPATAKYKEVGDGKYEEFLRVGDADVIAINSVNTPQLFWLIKSKGAAGSDKTKAAYNNGPQPSIKCSLAWDIFLEMMWAESAKHIPNILLLTAGSWDSLEGKQKACEFLTTKMYDDAPVTKGGGAPCDIQPGVALALLANHLGYMDTFQRVLKRHVNGHDPLNPKAHSSIAASTSLFLNGNYNIRMPSEIIENHTSLGMPVGVVQNSSTYTDPTNGKTFSTTDYAPAVTLNLMQGITSTEQVGLPIYIMTQARRELYTRAMHMPYYQGICLYLIAVAYPFLALLVLLPGKAAVFLNVPLAWLWIKSWDIGFAAVILLERVMYNLLPNASIAPQLRTKEAWDWQKLPIILGEGFNFNHVQNIAQYYTILAMATAGIPVITGVIVLKAKKAILSSFVGAIDSTARDAGMREAGAYSIASSNERSELRSRIEGFAKQQVILGAGGIEGGTRVTLGEVRGYSKVMNNALGHMKNFDSKADSLKNIQAIAKSSKNVGVEFMEAYGGGVKGATSFEAQHRAVFDPMFGRWGIMQMYADAYAAALDGAGTRLSGGFETNAQKANVLDAHMAMLTGSVENVISLERQRADLIGTNMANAIIPGNDIKANILAGAFTAEYFKQEEKLGKFNLFSAAFELAEGTEDGYANGLGYQRFLGFSAETMLESYKQMTDPNASPEDKARLNSLLSMNGVTGDYFKFMYGNESVRAGLEAIPGGASGQHFYGFGGNRTVHEVNADGSIGRKVSGRDLQSGGFLNDMQTSVKAINTLGIQELDQEKIFHEHRIILDNTSKEQDFDGYREKFLGSIQYLSGLDILQGKYLQDSYKFDPTEGESKESKETMMSREAVKFALLVKDLADPDKATNPALSQEERELRNSFLGAQGKFSLPQNIDQFAQTNPVYAVEILENYFENLSQAQKAFGASEEFKRRTGLDGAGKNIISSPRAVLQSN